VTTRSDSVAASVVPATFGFSLPTRIRFGDGIRAEAGAQAAAFGTRAVLVTGSSFERNPAAAAVRTSLADAGVTIADEVVGHGEPNDDAVLELARRIGDADAAVVIAVGGGSPLDLAKAAALQPTPDRLDALLGGERVATRGLPVVALPTTAGSGAEVSHAAIVFHRASGRKRGVRGPGVAAAVALVDPELMIGAPPAVVASAGFDAIAHALETSASRAAGDLVIGLAAMALPRLLDAVPAAVREPSRVDDLASAAYAAMLMGINLANSTTCLPHRLQYPVGARTGTSHARGVAALFPAWMERTVLVAPAALARLARPAGIAAPLDDDETAAGALRDRVVAHLEATGMRLTLADLGVSSDDLPGLVAAVEGAVANDPGPTEPGDLLDLYAASV
jgi:alcohol dehydrogenase class IV